MCSAGTKCFADPDFFESPLRLRRRQVHVINCGDHDDDQPKNHKDPELTQITLDDTTDFFDVRVLQVNIFQRMDLQRKP